jgi:hypothetical protein
VLLSPVYHFSRPEGVHGNKQSSSVKKLTIAEHDFFPRPDKNVRPERRVGFHHLQALSKQPASEAKRNGSGCAARKPSGFQDVFIQP